MSEQRGEWSDDDLRGLAHRSLVERNDSASMIVFDHVTHVFKNRIDNSTRQVLSSVNVAIPTDRRIALFGDPPEDRRIVVDLLAGLATPTVGRVVRKARLSFPAGDLRMFAPDLSTRLNVEHVARLYAADRRIIVRFVERATNIGPDFDKPYGALPKDLRVLISHIVAYCIPFEVYILSDAIRGGRKDLNQVANELLRARAGTFGIIVPTRDVRFAREICDMGILLRDRKIYLFDDVGGAIEAFQDAHHVRRSRHG